MFPHDLSQVRDQYEAFPYPERDPDDERRRLVRTWLDDRLLLRHAGAGEPPAVPG